MFSLNVSLGNLITLITFFPLVSTHLHAESQKEHTYHPFVRFCAEHIAEYSCSPWSPHIFTQNPKKNSSITPLFVFMLNILPNTVVPLDLYTSSRRIPKRTYLSPLCSFLCWTYCRIQLFPLISTHLHAESQKEHTYHPFVRFCAEHFPDYSCSSLFLHIFTQNPSKNIRITPLSAFMLNILLTGL